MTEDNNDSDEVLLAQDMKKMMEFYKKHAKENIRTMSLMYSKKDEKGNSDKENQEK